MRPKLREFDITTVTESKFQISQIFTFQVKLKNPTICMELAAIIKLISKKRLNTFIMYCREIRVDSFSLSLSFLSGSFADASLIYFNDASSKIRKWKLFEERE